MLDIKSATAAVTTQTAQATQTGGNLESVAQNREAEDSFAERKEVEKSETGPGVGEKVDVSA